MCFMSGMFPLNYNMFDIWRFLAFLCDDKLRQASVSDPAVWCSIRPNKSQPHRFNPFIVQWENFFRFLFSLRWRPWNACTTITTTLVSLIHLLYIYFQVFWQGRKFITAHPSTSSFLLLAVSQVRLLLIKFSADIMLLVFPSGSSCYASLIAAEGPKFEENNKLWRGKKWKLPWLEATGEEGRRWVTGRAPVTLPHHHFYLLLLFLRLSLHRGRSQLCCFAAARWELNLTSDFFRLFRWRRIAVLAFLISSLSLVQARSSFPSAATMLARFLPTPPRLTPYSTVSDSRVQLQCSAREDLTLPYFHHLNKNVSSSKPRNANKGWNKSKVINIIGMSTWK